MLPEYLLRSVELYYGLIRPGLATRHGLQRRDYEWLKYWIIYAIFQCLCFWSGLLFGGWLPFYDELEVLLLSYISLTSPHSSAWLYERMQYQFKIFEPHIDCFVQRVRQLPLWTALMATDELPEERLDEQQLCWELTQLESDIAADEAEQQIRLEQEVRVKLELYTRQLNQTLHQSSNQRNASRSEKQRLLSIIGLLNEKLQRQELHDKSESPNAEQMPASARYSLNTV